MLPEYFRHLEVEEQRAAVNYAHEDLEEASPVELAEFKPFEEPFYCYSYSYNDPESAEGFLLGICIDRVAILCSGEIGYLESEETFKRLPYYAR